MPLESSNKFEARALSFTVDSVVKCLSDIADSVRSTDDTLEPDLSYLAQLEGKLFAGVSHIRRFQNSKAFINKLPPEILAEAFFYLIPSPLHVDALANCRKTRNDVYRWLIVTGVCKHWRASAILFPRLWSNAVLDVSTYDVQLVEMFVQRSSQCPLDLAFTNPLAISHPWLVQLLNRVAPRLRTLTISFPLPHDLISQITAPAPQLSHLLFTGRSFNFSAVDDSALFSGHLPGLRHLCVSQSLVRSLPTFSRRITHLCISWTCQPLHSFPVGSFLQTIKQNENLEELIIANLNDVPERGLLSSTNSDPIHLLHLRRLRLSDCSCWTAEQILTRFVLQHPVAVRVHNARAFDNDNDNVESLIRTSKTCIRGFSPTQLHLGSNQSLDLITVLLDKLSVFELSLRAEHADLGVIARQLHLLMPLSHIKELHVELKHPILTPLSRLQGMTNLHHIYFSNNSIHPSLVSERLTTYTNQIIWLIRHNRQYRMFPFLAEITIYNNINLWQWKEHLDRLRCCLEEPSLWISHLSLLRIQTSIASPSDKLAQRMLPKSVMVILQDCDRPLFPISYPPVYETASNTMFWPARIV